MQAAQGWCSSIWSAQEVIQKGCNLRLLDFTKVAWPHLPAQQGLAHRLAQGLQHCCIVFSTPAGGFEWQLAPLKCIGLGAP